MKRLALFGVLIALLAVGVGPIAHARQRASRQGFTRRSPSHFHHHVPHAHHHGRSSPYRNSQSLAARETRVEVDSTQPIAGTAHLPVLLVDFGDQPARREIHKPSDYDALLFKDGYPYGAGSMRDYFQDQSGNLFDITGEVSSWLRLPQSYAAYAGNSYGYQTTAPNDWTLVQDAVSAADSQVDFCRSDTDRDGFVDTLFLIHAGAGAEETGSGIWSLRWRLTEPLLTEDICADGQRVKISDFVIEPEQYSSDRFTPTGAPDRMISIGMFVHEFGHALGLPDLYDIDSSSPGGVGAWDVMASGAWGYHGNRPWKPTPLSAWSKIELGWAEPRVVSQDSLSVPIASADAPHAGVFRGILKLVPEPGSAEYFLVENREPVGWAADFPQGGLAVWHVDESQRRSDNSDNSLDNRRLLTLVQADGLDELGGSGASGTADAGDLFPGSSNTRGVGDTTSPSLKLNSGMNSHLLVQSIHDPAATTTADILIDPQLSDPPLAPTELNANAVSDEIGLSWKPSSTDDVTAYRVYRALSSGSFSWVGTVGGASTSFQDDSVSPGVAYEYRVRAFKGLESVDSDPVRVIAPGTDRSILTPTSLVLKRASSALGSLEQLRNEDGASVIISSERHGSVQKLVYVAVVDISKAEKRAPRAAILNLAAAERIKRVGIALFDTRSQSWTRVGSETIAPGFPARVLLRDLGSRVSPAGLVRLRFTSAQATRFSHYLDWLGLELR